MREEGREFSSMTGGIKIELGDHPDSATDYQKLGRNFFGGDLSVNAWNPEVGKRVAVYKPDTLALDGQPRTWGENDFSRIEKAEIWIRLPSRVATLRPKDCTIQIVCGDVAFTNTPVITSPDVDPNKYDQVRYGERDFQQKMTAIAKLSANVGALLVAAGTTIGENTDSRGEKSRGLTRRQFLRRAALTVAGVISTNLMAGWTRRELQKMAAKGEDASEADAAIDGADFLSKFTPWNEYVDGRTALLIAKTREVSNNAAILLGYSHGTRLRELLSSAQTRGKLIAGLATYELDLMDRIIDEYFPGADKVEAADKMRLLITTTQVAEVKDVENELRSGDPLGYVDRHVRLISTQICKEAEDAVKPVFEAYKEKVQQ